MHQVSAKHRALGRSVAELDERDPSLINLPLPANSIPVVGELAHPLLGNGANGGAQPSTSPPAPISTPGSGGGNGNGGDSGNGGGGGNGNGNGNGGGDNGGGNKSTPTASPTSGGGTPVSIVPSPTSPNLAPGNPSSSPGGKDGNGGGSAASPSGTGGGGNFLGISGGQAAPVNVGSGPSINPVALGASAPAGLATGFLSPSQSSLGTGSNTATPLSTISTAGAVSPGKQLSGGAIAGITVVCLFFLLALILLVIRHRLIARRVELRRQWWFGRSGPGHNLSLGSSGSSRSPVGSNGEVQASRLSARSSFATNFDQGLMFRIDSPSGFSLGLAPDLPPTAEVRERNSILISTGASVARRESMNSMLSNGSDPGAQYLTVSTGENNLEPSSMSVRPFSPSESFAFPKPPAPPSSAVDSFFISGTPGPAFPQSSATTLVHLSTPPRALMTDLPPASVSTSPYPPIATLSSTLSPIAVSNPSMDPFADPTKPEFSDAVVIRRPFTPSLDDELAVRSGDRVHIFRIFDDGWAFVERLAGTGRERHDRGLIPVDCFREVDQALPTFLAEKRVSYGSDKLIAIAL